MSDICVVHLVRKRNGVEAFRNFLMSYVNHDAGVQHDLLIVFKGFRGAADLSPYQKLLEFTPHRSIAVADFGFDLRPYFIAARVSRHKYMCFLNSFSVIKAPRWLQKMHSNLIESGVGIVGATGSWQSICPGPMTTKSNIALWKACLRPFLWRIARAYLGWYFSPFPNAHVRTNAFLIMRENMLNIRSGIILTKMHAYCLESGKNSITKQIERMGLRAIVVGADGLGYEKDQWHKSNTFWSGGQANLLIADNQTRKYLVEDDTRRACLERFAWGQPDLTMSSNNHQRDA